MGAAQCKPCGPADPTSDTVKVDHTLLSGPGALPAAGEKEWGAQEPQMEDDARFKAEAEAEAERERQRAAEAAAAAEEEEERRRAEEAQRAEQERADRDAEARAAAAQEEADAERAAAAQAAADEESRGRAERERLAAEAQQFLRARGFKSAIAPRKKCFKVSYPLHAAVEENSAEMVHALLICGADRSKKNSAGKTPFEWATKLNKRGSHDAVLTALQAVVPQ